MAAHKPSVSRRLKVPQTMRASVIDRFGPPSLLAIQEVAVPELGARDVLIAVYGAGIGYWDAQIRDGTWAQGNEKFPLILGTDGAGIVVATGSQVRRFKPGARVWAYQEYGSPKGGFYAEYAAVNMDYVGAAPDELSLVEAGSAVVTGLTAFQGIDDYLRVRRGQTVLIFGGTGAVGHLAIQFAARRGAHVVATASDRAGIRLVTKLGAHGTFDARRDDALDELRKQAPRGIDAVLALVGGTQLEKCLELLKPGGRVAAPNGVEPMPKPRLGMVMTSYDPEAGARQWQRLGKAVAEAHLQVKVAAIFALDAAAAAHKRLEQGHLQGRLALRVRRGEG